MTPSLKSDLENLVQRWTADGYTRDQKITALHLAIADITEQSTVNNVDEVDEDEEFDNMPV